MNPSGDEQGAGEQRAQSGLSRLGGAIRPPKKYDLDRGATDSSVTAEPVAEKKDFATDLALDQSLSFEIAKNSAVSKNEVAGKSDAVEKEAVVESEKIVPLANVKKSDASVEAEDKIPERNIIRPSRNAASNNFSVQTNWADVIKINNLSDEQRKGARSIIRAASARVGKRLEVDYAEKIDLSNTKFTRPFVIHFVSMREEETRRKLEREQEIKLELQKEVSEKPIELSEADVAEANAIAPTDTHSDESIEAYPIEERQPLKKSVILSIVAVIALAVIGVIVSVMMRKDDSAKADSEIWLNFISAKNGPVLMSGKSTVENNDSHEAKFDLAWSGDAAKLRIKRSGLDYTIFDNGEISFKIDDMSAQKEIALSRTIFEGDAAAEVNEKPKFINQAVEDLTSAWIEVDSDKMHDLLSLVDEKYQKKADCLGFLNKDLRNTLAYMNFLKDAEENSIFNISYSGTEWNDILDSVPISDKKDDFVACWGSHNFRMTGEIKDSKISKLDITLENESDTVKLELVANENLSVSRDGDSVDYEEITHKMRETIKEGIMRSRETEVKSKCVTLETDCAKTFMDGFAKTADELSDGYFLYLFGLRDGK